MPGETGRRWRIYLACEQRHVESSAQSSRCRNDGPGAGGVAWRPERPRRWQIRECERRQNFSAGIAAQLPWEIAHYLLEPRVAPERFSSGEFVKRIALRENCDYSDAAFHARCVIDARGTAETLGRRKPVGCKDVRTILRLILVRPGRFDPIGLISFRSLIEQPRCGEKIVESTAGILPGNRGKEGGNWCCLPLQAGNRQRGIMSPVPLAGGHNRPAI